MKLQPPQALSLTIVCAAVLAAGCAAFEGQRQQRHATRLVDFLHPGDTQRIERPSTPVLPLPLKVGIAFVPESRPARESYAPAATLDESRKHALLQNVADRFRSLPLVGRIEVIPTPYLTPQGSFENLDQLKRMFDLDVIALLSYDQVQFTDESGWSFAYWTIVGAYIVQGERNDTRTLLDCALFDISSRRMLFRAPGVSAVKNSATPVNLSQQLRRDSETGFDQAATNLVANLHDELTRFKARIKEKPQEVQVVARPGFDMGAASFDGISALALAALALAGLWRKHQAP
jgi:rhombotail lipoprotein